MVLIGIVGLKRTGKDTMADYLIKNYGYNKVAFADPIKDILNILFGWDKELLESNMKDEKCELDVIPRDMMKWIGTDIFQYEIYKKFPNLKIKKNTIWVEAIKNKIKDIDKTVISDVRFLHEVEFIKENNGILVYIDKIELTTGLDYDLDIIIKNYIDYKVENKDTKDKFYKNINNFVLMALCATKNV